jgi:hypothetical protein
MVCTQDEHDGSDNPHNQSVHCIGQIEMKSEASHSQGNISFARLPSKFISAIILSVDQQQTTNLSTASSSCITMRGEHCTNTNLNHHRDAPPHTTTMAAHQYNTISIYDNITPHHEA